MPSAIPKASATSCEDAGCIGLFERNFRAGTELLRRPVTVPRRPSILPLSSFTPSGSPSEPGRRTGPLTGPGSVRVFGRFGVVRRRSRSCDIRVAVCSPSADSSCLVSPSRRSQSSVYAFRVHGVQMSKCCESMMTLRALNGYRSSSRIASARMSSNSHRVERWRIEIHSSGVLGVCTPYILNSTQMSVAFPPNTIEHRLTVDRVSKASVQSQCRKCLGCAEVLNLTIPRESGQRR